MKIASPLGALVVTQATGSDAPVVGALRDELARWMQERGIRLIGRGLWYVSHAHTDADVDRAIMSARAVFMEMR